MIKKLLYVMAVLLSTVKIEAMQYNNNYQLNSQNNNNKSNSQMFE